MRAARFADLPAGEGRLTSMQALGDRGPCSTGASREEAAKLGGMDRQTLRDWVIRFNEQGPDGLINLPSLGAPAKLNHEHRAFLVRMVDDGPIPAIHGVVRWRACDLIMRLHEEFALSVSDDTILLHVWRTISRSIFVIPESISAPLHRAPMTLSSPFSIAV